MENIERWLPLVGFESAYEVSDLGRFRSKRRNGTLGGILSQCKVHSGYMTVHLSINNKSCRKIAHRLVLMTFIGHPPDGYEGAHLNGIRTDNRLENLAWTTKVVNCSHKRIHGTAPLGVRNGSAKLTETDVAKIRSFGRRLTQPRLAEMYGVSRSLISAIQRREIWSHI